MLIPFLVFWVLIFLGYEDLGMKGVGIAVLVWSVLLVACVGSGLSPYYFVAIQSAIDIVLVLIVFGGDITLR